MEIENDFSFHCEDIEYELIQKPAVISWLSYSITNEGKIPGEISFIFCSDEYLHSMNVKHLQHDTLTDIITFDYCEENEIHGDLFISIERVAENAVKFGVPTEVELHRVMVHGIMHLCGYKDKTTEDQNVMSAKEDFYLNLRKF